MANLIQFKRGNSASLPTVAEAGEPLFTTDTGRLYIGTGTGVTPIGAANANEIVLTPVGSISSINVQAAINELDNEKASLA
jgi:hypothetical protein